LKVIKAIYNFIVGDMTILIGVIAAFIVLALISNIAFLASLRPFSGAILVIAVLAVLAISLSREVRG
jgi:hypothetical protein